jgi:hypothetical protein
MLRIKSNTLGETEKKHLGYILYEICDAYGDFYLTKDNIRIPFRDNKEIFYECIQKGDKVIYDDDREDGVAIILGYSDKSPRKYLKILSKSPDAISRMLKFINWHVNKIPLYIKIKKNNPLVNILRQNNFSFQGNRGNELLMCKQVKVYGASNGPTSPKN